MWWVNTISIADTVLLSGPDNEQLYCADGKSVDGGWDGHVKAVPVRLFEKLKIEEKK